MHYAKGLDSVRPRQSRCGNLIQRAKQEWEREWDLLLLHGKCSHLHSIYQLKDLLILLPVIPVLMLEGEQVVFFSYERRCLLLAYSYLILADRMKFRENFLSALRKVVISLLTKRMENVRQLGHLS